VNTHPGAVFTTLHFLRNLRIDPISKSVPHYQAGKQEKYVQDWELSSQWIKSSPNVYIKQ
jgi:hypothetical protein